MRKIVACIAACGSMAVGAGSAFAGDAYRHTVLVANLESYNPTALVDPLLQNGWGIALRPPGAGGHIWISNFATGTTTTYVGDVHDASGRFTPLHQDDLKVVNIGKGAGVRVNGELRAPTPQVTGQVYNHSATDFVVSGEGLTAASKFIFVTAEGTISGWVEQKDPLPDNPSHMKRQTVSVVMVDQSHEYDDDRLRYTGCAITDFPSDNRLYVTNYITGEVEVYDKSFKRIAMPSTSFRYPGQRLDYFAWNIQYFRSGPNGEGRLWVAYAQGEEPWEQMPDTGDVAEFDLEGNFIQRLHQKVDADPYANGELRAPWGLAFAPDNFGPFSGALLVANFGDGTIVGYDASTGKVIDFIRDESGEPIVIDGVWGLTFGNGVSLGDSNALYYAAGPNVETDGAFGSIRFICRSDLNNDNKVDAADYHEFIRLDDALDGRADLNGDTVVDFLDSIAFLNLYSTKR